MKATKQAKSGLVPTQLLYSALLKRATSGAVIRVSAESARHTLIFPGVLVYFLPDEGALSPFRTERCLHVQPAKPNTQNPDPECPPIRTPSSFRRVPSTCRLERMLGLKPTHLPLYPRVPPLAPRIEGLVVCSLTLEVRAVSPTSSVLPRTVGHHFKFNSTTLVRNRHLRAYPIDIATLSLPHQRQLTTSKLKLALELELSSSWDRAVPTVFNLTLVLIMLRL